MANVVSTSFESFVIDTYSQAYRDSSLFTAGQIQHCKDQWVQITSDREILQMVNGYKLEFIDNPVQNQPPSSFTFDDTEIVLIENEIQDLLQLGVLIECEREQGDFLSNIFLRPKKDGSVRMILNLKTFNTSLEYHHFKMDTLKSALALMRPQCYMASIDLKHAYYSVPIDSEHQKFLKFAWKNTFYKYTCFANGLSPCPRKFTKLLKPVLSKLRCEGHEVLCYIDDIYLKADTYQSCCESVTACVQLLNKLGFVIHPEKSILTPTKALEFLGFQLNSEEMTVSLTPEKQLVIQKECLSALCIKNPSIRYVCHVIGLLVAAFPGVMYGPLYYRSLERDKIDALKHSRGDFDKTMCLSSAACEELNWWERNVNTSYSTLTHDDPSMFIATDSSSLGWGAFNKSSGLKTGGEWLPSERSKHINIQYLTKYEGGSREEV